MEADCGKGVGSQVVEPGMEGRKKGEVFGSEGLGETLPESLLICVEAGLALPRPGR